jgi:outer membrane cobalamin receptor
MKKALLFAGALLASFSLSAQEASASADSLFNMLDEITVTSDVIDIAKVRETPVAVSTISPSDISLKVGNMEFPEIMNNTPGVYATKQGGGYGDSRISLRGFDQRNTSFLINGQPVNDMENGWVYWSNWQGLTDVASGIQIQRGLGASRLAVPSVGGTVSIFTKVAENKEGGTVTAGVGNDGYIKTGASYNTGRNDKGWASSFLLSRWMGNGYVYNTQGEGYTYFAAIAYDPKGSNHSLNFSFLGAGQWHHQRDVEVSLRDYDYFGDGGRILDDGVIDPRWNSNGGMMTVDDEQQEFSMRRNFYNKPLATLNWDWDINSDLKLATSAYASAGRGGGTGPRGRNYDVLPYQQDLYSFIVEDGKTDFRTDDGMVDYDAIVADNRASANPHDGSVNDNYTGMLIGSHQWGIDADTAGTISTGGGMIRRASMNSHNWYGVISNLEYTTGNIKMSAGVDLRDYTGYHYRALNNLMGFDAYYSGGNRNNEGQIIESTIEASPFSNTGLVGPKIDYFNVGRVQWAGLNGMIEYNDQEKLTAVMQAGWSQQNYRRIDYFDQPGNHISDWSRLNGGYIKGGANYNLNEEMNIFFNAGLIARQPLFDAVFPGFANDVNPDLENEIIQSFELGYAYITNDLQVNINVYNTNWGNRFVSNSFDYAFQDTIMIDDAVIQAKGIDVVHSGLELEAKYQASSKLRLNTMLSIGNWRYTSDINVDVFDDNRNMIENTTLYTNGAKVGDAAQTTMFIGVDYNVAKNLTADIGFRYVDDLYADYSLVNSEFLKENNEGALQLPSFSLIDMGLTSRFELAGNMASLRLNVNNVANTMYIAESNSNIHAAAGDDTWNGISTANYVWMGFGRTWNATFRYNF